MSINKTESIDFDGNFYRLSLDINWADVPNIQNRAEIAEIACQIHESINDIEKRILMLVKEAADPSSEGEEDDSQEIAELSFEPHLSPAYPMSRIPLPQVRKQGYLNTKIACSGAGASSSDDEIDDEDMSEKRRFRFENHDLNPDEIQRHVPSFSEIMLMRKNYPILNPDFVDYDLVDLDKASSDIDFDKEETLDFEVCHTSSNGTPPSDSEMPPSSPIEIIDVIDRMNPDEIKVVHIR